jgi:hypothetical protein
VAIGLLLFRDLALRVSGGPFRRTPASIKNLTETQIAEVVPGNATDL